MIREPDELPFTAPPPQVPYPVPIRPIATPPVRSADRAWWEIAFPLALEIAGREGEVWPDDLTLEMARRGHTQPLGQSVSSFWAWAARNGLRQLPKRRMSRDPDRNGSKIFAYEIDPAYRPQRER